MGVTDQKTIPLKSAARMWLHPQPLGLCLNGHPIISMAAHANGAGPAAPDYLRVSVLHPSPRGFHGPRLNRRFMSNILLINTRKLRL